MSIVCILAMLAGSAIVASGAELRGAWSASSSGGLNLAGTWTAEAHPAGGVTGAWTLRDATGKTLMAGGWSASKAPRGWNGAWQATIQGRANGYAGTWTSSTPLDAEARLEAMLESALRVVVGGTWKSGAQSGAWSIRTSP